MSEAVEAIEIRERFDVDNDMKAEWCLSKIRRIRADQKREKEELQRQMQFYLDQIEMIDTKADEDVAFFESLLRPYFNDRVDSGFAKAAKTQVSYKLPSGKLILKKREPKYDPKGETFLKWLKDNNLKQFVKVEESPKWNDFKKTLPKDDDGNIKMVVNDGKAELVTAEGEIVPGVAVTLQDDDFIVEA